jgi:hypothetical protein
MRRREETDSSEFALLGSLGLLFNVEDWARGRCCVTVCNEDKQGQRESSLWARPVYTAPKDKQQGQRKSLPHERTSRLGRRTIAYSSRGDAAPGNLAMPSALLKELESAPPPDDIQSWYASNHLLKNMNSVSATPTPGRIKALLGGHPRSPLQGDPKHSSLRSGHGKGLQEDGSLSSSVCNGGATMNARDNNSTRESTQSVVASPPSGFHSSVKGASQAPTPSASPTVNMRQSPAGVDARAARNTQQAPPGASLSPPGSARLSMSTSHGYQKGSMAHDTQLSRSTSDMASVGMMMDAGQEGMGGPFSAVHGYKEVRGSVSGAGDTFQQSQAHAHAQWAAEDNIKLKNTDIAFLDGFVHTIEAGGVLSQSQNGAIRGSSPITDKIHIQPALQATVATQHSVYGRSEAQVNTIESVGSTSFSDTHERAAVIRHRSEGVEVVRNHSSSPAQHESASVRHLHRNTAEELHVVRRGGSSNNESPQRDSSSNHASSSRSGANSAATQDASPPQAARRRMHPNGQNSEHSNTSNNNNNNNNNSNAASSERPLRANHASSSSSSSSSATIQSPQINLRPVRTDAGGKAQPHHYQRAAMDRSDSSDVSLAHTRSAERTDMKTDNASDHVDIRSHAHDVYVSGSPGPFEEDTFGMHHNVNGQSPVDSQATTPSRRTIVTPKFFKDLAGDNVACRHEEPQAVCGMFVCVCVCV